MPTEATTSRPVVLVTGASSGIGAALVRKLREGPYRVVATARGSSCGQLAELKETDHFLVRELDVTSEFERQRCVSEIEARWGAIDVLVNNAGISYRAVIEHMSELDEQLQMQTNYFGPMGLIRLVLPTMRSRRCGRIVNVSSVGGMMAMPTMGSYSASKFALEGASEALWYELRPFGIHVSLVQPGFIHSNAFRKVLLSARARESSESDDDYSHYYRHMGAFVGALMERSKATSSSVAEIIVRTIADPCPALRVPATVDATFFAILRRAVPRRLYHRFLYSQLPGVKTWGKSGS